MCIQRWCSKIFILPIRCIRFEFFGSSIMLIRAIHKVEDRQYGFRFDWWELKQFILIFVFMGIVDRRFLNRWAEYNQNSHAAWRCITGAGTGELTQAAAACTVVPVAQATILWKQRSATQTQPATLAQPWYSGSAAGCCLCTSLSSCISSA
jgi:hypothetical protein